VDHREPKAADRGLDELWAADELIGYTLVLDTRPDAWHRVSPRPNRIAGGHRKSPAKSNDRDPTQ
jgi:hypothetical protein